MNEHVTKIFQTATHWMRRHKIWTAVIIFLLIVLVSNIGHAITSGGSDGSRSSGHSEQYRAGHAFGHAAAAGAGTPEGTVFAQYYQNTGAGAITDAQYACDQMGYLGASGIEQAVPQGESIPSSEMPVNNSEQWLLGCVAGFTGQSVKQGNQPLP